MKKLITLSIILLSSLSYTQQYTLPSKLVEKYIMPNKNKDIIIQSSIDKDNFYEVTLKYHDSISSFKLKPLTFPNFKVKFKDAIIDVVTKNNVLNTNAGSLQEEEIQNEIAYVFTQLVTYYNTQDERPEVASIVLKQNIPVYYENKKQKTLNKFENNLEDVVVEISFYGGFIEKMQVNGTINGIPISFNNKFSIGISSTKNITELGDYILYSNEQLDETYIKKLQEIPSKADFEKLAKNNNSIDSLITELKINELKIESTQQVSLVDKLKKAIESNDYQYFKEKLNSIMFIYNPNPQIKKRKNLIPLFIYVDDIIRYIKKVDVNANDISPVPQLVILDKNQRQTKLFKEESSKLFEAVVYTDFLGVFDEANPNGIIQTEVNKKFNLNTKRVDWFGLLFEGYGLLQSFNAQFQFSKIEKNNKFLLPSTFNVIDNIGNITETKTYYTPISLLQYRNFAIGGMLNFLTLENQNAKLNMFFDIGFLFGRSGIKETEDQVDGTFVNNLEIPFELKLQLLPEKRISFSISDKLSWFESFNADIPLKSIENNILVNKNRFLNSFNVDLGLDISSSGKLFLRYKLVHELDNINNNFSQLQFGYSFYLLQSNGVKKNN